MANKKKQELDIPCALALRAPLWLEQTSLASFNLLLRKTKGAVLLSAFTHEGKIKMSKILVYSAIWAMLLGPLSAWASPLTSPKTDETIVSASQASDLASQCRIEARQRHNVGVFPRKLSRNSAVVRRHSIALIEFCDAFEGKPSTEFWIVISRSSAPSDRQSEFLSACLSEANGGRRTVFKPSRRHVEGMAAICREMSEKLPSE
ncbi:hypothetical protein [Novosphingobium sp. PASSN1]|uniref:hypothetical protein n=1 Tax=Novosphingobium sp. PASSN1 TaxID=2015561 RepID=UPI0025D7E233|nr:hypothetical protein [Novosphingobium sp. PASSN1]